MNTNQPNAIKENKMKVTASTLMRLAGLSAILAGVCFLVIGIFHPMNIPSSVTTATWIIVHYFATALGFFGLFGIAGLYEIRIKGHLNDRRAAEFEGLTVTREENGCTLLTGRFDQSGLHGLLRKVRDLGMPLVSVVQV